MSLLVTSHPCVALWGLSLCAVCCLHCFRNISFILIFLPDFPVSKSLESSELWQPGSCLSYPSAAFTSNLFIFSFVFCSLTAYEILQKDILYLLKPVFPKYLRNYLVLDLSLIKCIEYSHILATCMGIPASKACICFAVLVIIIYKVISSCFILKIISKSLSTHIFVVFLYQHMIL